MRRIIDSHVHLWVPGAYDFLMAYIEKAGLASVSMASIGSWGNGLSPEEIILPLIFKEQNPKLYAYGSLTYPETPIGASVSEKWKPEKQAERLISMGFDGIKLIESKPDAQKKLGMPLNSDFYRSFFDFIEAADVPVLWHVADPPEFWDEAKAPAFAAAHHWIYDDSFSSWKKLNEEVLSVLTDHPKLRVVFAHFFFRSGDIEDAERILERFPNVSFDLTPGIEMYENFTKDYAAWRTFFLKYSDRILLGTDADEEADFLMDNHVKPEDTPALILRFLETDEAFSFWGRKVHGLNLPSDVVDKIAAGNFEKMTGTSPKAVNHEMLVAYAKEYFPYIKERTWVSHLPDYPVSEPVETKQWLKEKLEL